MKLIKHEPFPSGEFQYSQNVDGKVYSWGGDGLSLLEQSKRVAKFRSANGVPRSSLSEVMEDIDIYTCNRLGNNKRWCSDGTKVYTETHSSGGGCCGAKL